MLGLRRQRLSIARCPGDNGISFLTQRIRASHILHVARQREHDGPPQLMADQVGASR